MADNPAHKLRLTRAENWVNKLWEDGDDFNGLDMEYLPPVLVRFEEFLMQCEEERKSFYDPDIIAKPEKK